MKIKSIQISNILSFEHKDRIEDCQEINFSKTLNVLIGANGSGKSNFLEILNKIFKQVLFVPCRFVEEQKHLHEIDSVAYSLSRTIQFIQLPPMNLAKNKDHRDKPMKIRIKIQLTDNDISNLKFIQENIDEIESISFEYSNDRPLSSFDIKSIDISSIRSVTLDMIEVSTGLEVPDVKNPPDRFVFLYLRWFNFIQNLITIGIEWKSKNWEPLKNSFAIVSHTSNYDVIGDVYSIASSGLTETKSRKYENIISRLMEENIRLSRNGEPLIFERVKHLLSYEYKKLQSKYGENAKELLSQYLILQQINESLSEILKISYRVEEDPMNAGYIFNFLDSLGKKISNYQFSSGEKTIIHFIFSLYGFEIQNGLIVLDEPELHIHPQMQQKLLKILEQAIHMFGLQIILATHSPVFVNSKTIDGIHRFYKEEDKFTRVTNPIVTTDEKDLIQILTYTNSAKIFFSNKVVLVEGDSDEYFFRFFFDRYIINKKKEDLDVEFLYIGGKGRLPLWKEFLTKYEIKTYYIGDLDNILDDNFSITDDIMMKTLKTEFEIQPDILQKINTIPKYEKGSKCYTKDLLNFIKTKKSTEWSTIKSKIENQYSNRIYLLQEGELEDYLNSHNKLKGVIEFCKNKFNNWYGDQANKTKTNELDKIFDLITA